MTEIQHKKGKIFYSMGEVTEMFDVNPSLIRFWEQKFDILKPHKNKKGNRMFTPEDVDNLKLIYHLVKEKGMTLAGAQKRIKDNKEGAKRDIEIIDRLQSIRAMLLEIRQELKDDGTGIGVADSFSGDVILGIESDTVLDPQTYEAVENTDEIEAEIKAEKDIEEELKEELREEVELELKEEIRAEVEHEIIEDVIEELAGNIDEELESEVILNDDDKDEAEIEALQVAEVIAYDVEEMDEEPVLNSIAEEKPIEIQPRVIEQTLF